MKTISRNEVSAHFRLPTQHLEPVIVSRFLHDGSLKPIGRIYQNIDVETGCTVYVSTDNKGEEVFPPSIDYQDVECQFEKYAKSITQKSLAEDWEAKAIEHAEREEELKKMRKEKIINSRIQHINV
jgi:hypothetical protein